MRVTETIHHGDYRNVRTLITDHVDGPTLQAWGEASPYAWRHPVGERIAAELLANGRAEHGWARYALHWQD